MLGGRKPPGLCNVLQCPHYMSNSGVQVSSHIVQPSYQVRVRLFHGVAVLDLPDCKDRPHEHAVGTIANCLQLIEMF